MIPLESATAILPRMPTGRAITGEFPLTIIKPPVVDVKARASPSAVSSPIYRLLRSRNQRRNSSASSARSSCSTKPECKEFVTERVEVFDLKVTGQQRHEPSHLLQCQNQDTFTLPDKRNNCQEKSGHSRRSSLISSAKERHIFTQEQSLELTPEHSGVDKDKGQPCDSTDRMEESKQSDSSSVKETELQPENFLQTKENKISQSENINKRSRKKSCKAKRTHKKRKNSMKKSLFARFVGSHVQKKQQGQLVNSNEQVKPRVNIPQVRDTSPNKYLNIQKLHTAYAPKKNDNKTKNAILLPRVSNAILTKDNAGSCISAPRKEEEEEEELENALISPRTSSLQKLLNSDDGKVKKIYLSETHSGMIAGIPCAPPSTPTVDELKKVEYIPSLTDVKSQRAVKTRLVNLGNKTRAEEQRKKEKVLKEEQKRAYGAILQLKQRQRAEIYALNKVMTELENENFRKFMEEKSAESLPV